MRLQTIKIHGFKSFADAIEIQLQGSCMGVVGPNGCGKSNIMDALRWVLGESRANELRGEQMQDVLFNGSGQRKPAAKASVELVFSNDEGRIQGPWASFLELSVKRSLDRQNNSQYFINQQQVRRRDIHDLFMGTGLGPKAYAIIGQGMINRIIESKPEEMRLFLEEAAGISKYKERRKESINRLEDAQENCLRLADILQELEQQKTTLDEQAQAARAYKKSYQQLYLQQYALAEISIGQQKYDLTNHLQTQQLIQEQLAALNQELLLCEHQSQEIGAKNWQQRVQTTRGQLDVLKYQLVNEQAQQNYQQKLQQDWQSSQEKLQEYITQTETKIAELDEQLYEQQAQYEQVQELLFELEDAQNRFSAEQAQKISDVLQNLQNEWATAQKKEQKLEQEAHSLKQQVQWLVDKKKQNQSRIEALKPTLPSLEMINQAVDVHLFGNDLVDEQTRALQTELDEKTEALKTQNQQQRDLLLKIEQHSALLQAHLAGLDSLEKTLFEQQTLAQNLAEKLTQRRQQLQILEHEKQTIEKTIKQFKKIELTLSQDTENIQNTQNIQNIENDGGIEANPQILYTNYINTLLPKIDDAIYAQGFSDQFAELFYSFNDALQAKYPEFQINDDLQIQYKMQNLLRFMDGSTQNNNLTQKQQQMLFCAYLAIEQILQNDLIILNFFKTPKANQFEQRLELPNFNEFSKLQQSYEAAGVAIDLQQILQQPQYHWGELVLWFCQQGFIKISTPHFKYFIAFYFSFFKKINSNERLNLNNDPDDKNIYILEDFSLNTSHQQNKNLAFLFSHIQKTIQIEQLENQGAMEAILDQLQQQIIQLARKIETLKKDIEQQNTSAQQQNFFLKQLEEQSQNKRNQYQETQNVLQSMQIEVQSLVQSIAFSESQITQQQTVLQLKIEQIKTQAELQVQQQQSQNQQNQQLIEHFTQEIADIEIETEEKSAILYEQSVLLEQAQENSDALEKHVREQQQKQQQFNDQLQKMQQKEQNLQFEGKNLAQQIQSKTQQLKEQKQQRTQFLEQQQNPSIKIDEAQIAALHESIAILTESCNALQIQLNDEEAAFNQQQQQLQALQTQKEQGTQRLKDLYERQHQNELAVQQQDLQIENLNAQKQSAEEALQEKGFETHLPELLGNGQKWRDIDFAKDQEAIKQAMKDIKKDIDQAKKELQSLGDVNLQAIEAFEQAQKRFTELNDNYQDVQNAIGLLQNTITDIDQESRQMLQQTYEKSNQLFGELFPELFGGGQAHLMAQGDDILTGGIHIIAQPPGKKNSSIHLLSGGEKALTAIALIFAIFKLNPAPFCLLDEVDAPLDDSNTERYAKLIKTMSQYTQFLFISHNPIAMEVADYLIGVTMQEKGISRIVAVNVEETIAALKGA